MWDTTYSLEDYMDIFQSKKLTREEEKKRDAMLIKLMNFNSWYTLLEIFDVDTVKRYLLTDDVINGLFPRPLRKKYDFARNLLQ